MPVGGNGSISAEGPGGYDSLLGTQYIPTSFMTDLT
jgi:hypothetical protein